MIEHHVVRLVAVAALGLATPAAAALDTLAPSDLVPGQKAVVKTVFAGTRIETFGAEIVGVIEGGRAGGDVILGRATSGRALETGIAQGMSGSPVYVDGKLIGALASSWPFAREPLFGITPIGDMLSVLDHPTHSADPGTSGPSGAAATGNMASLSFRGLHWHAAPSHEIATQVDAPTPAMTAPALAGLSRLALPLSASHLQPAALVFAREWLEPHGLAVVQGGGTGSSTGHDHELEPGSAVAVDLLRGDLRLASIGTLTYRDGNRLLMFGHPFFQSGEVLLPLSTAEIAAVLPSRFVSFKLGMSGRPVGTVTQDRRAGVAGELGEAPALLPLSVTLTGVSEAARTYRFESIEDRGLAPTLIAIAALNSLLESGGVAANQTLRWSLTLQRHGAAPLTLSDVTAGNQPPFEMARGLISPLTFLFGNPYERLALDSVAVSIEVEPGRDLWTLLEARVLDAAVRPGATAHVQCVIERWRGGRKTLNFAIQVPREAPDGRYELRLGGAAELTSFESKQLPARYRPISLEDAWRRLASSRRSDGLYAALFARAPEVTIEGRDYPELPLSAVALLTSPQTRGTASRSGTLAKLDEVRLNVDGAVSGQIQASLIVDSKAP